MPIHLPPISRRRFLAGSLAAAAATVIGRRGWAAASAKIDASRVALWSATHLSGGRAKALPAAAATVIGRRGWAADSAKIDASRVALWSDTHLSGDRAKVLRDVNMWKHFEQSSADMLGQERLPSMVLVNGDLALTAGLPA